MHNVGFSLTSRNKDGGDPKVFEYIIETDFKTRRSVSILNEGNRLVVQEGISKITNQRTVELVLCS